MYGLSRIELILLPNHVREFITPSLEKAGIEVGLSARKLPRNLKNEGICYRCTDENAQVDLLVLSEDALKKMGIEQLAVLVSPSQSFFHELKFGSRNKKLRERVRSILYSLKESQTH